MRRPTRSGPALAAALALAGCSFAPAYERPKAPIANEFPAASQGRNAADLGWREVFADPRLQALIALALRDNRDLRIAALDVEVLRAQHRITRAELFPQIGGGATVDARGGANQFNPNASSGDVLVQYRLGGSVSYELDLFGRLRNANRAALEQYLASAEAHRAAHLALVGELVTQYLRERAFDEQRQIAEQTLAAVTEVYETTRRLLEAGSRSELDVASAEGQLHAARAEVARVTRLRAQAHNALVVLVGAPLPADLPPPQPLDGQRVVADIGSGVPSELLVRRPDILAAEHALKSANANIGVARAAFLPRISLTGFAGVASTVLTNLFSGGLAWTFTPQLTVPLFDGGRNRASLDVAKVRKQIEVARYEKAIQVAFREVADALVARTTLDAQLEAQTARTAAERRRYEISETRYKNGVESYLTVLTAQQDFYAAQQQLIEVRFARLANLADLYRALGGGWRERTQ